MNKLKPAPAPAAPAQKDSFIIATRSELKEWIGEEADFIRKVLKLADDSVKKGDGYACSHFRTAEQHVKAKMMYIGFLRERNDDEIKESIEKSGGLIGILWHRGKTRNLAEENMELADEIDSLGKQLEKIRADVEKAGGQDGEKPATEAPGGSQSRRASDSPASP